MVELLHVEVQAQRDPEVAVVSQSTTWLNMTNPEAVGLVLQSRSGLSKHKQRNLSGRTKIPWTTQRLTCYALLSPDFTKSGTKIRLFN